MDQTPMQGNARIMLVDDHPLIRHGFGELIGEQADMDVCAQAAGVADALCQLPATHPDLICVDLSLEDGSGLDFIKRVHAQHPEIKLLVVSMHDEVLFAERCLRAGASGFIGKGQATHHIVDAIRQVLRGKLYVSETIIERCLLAGRNPGEAKGVAALSDREIEVFGMIGQGQSTREIAECLHLSVKTVETHRDNMRKKLHLDSNAELIRYAVEWVLESA